MVHTTLTTLTTLTTPTQVHTINPEKKIFDRIDRLVAKGETFEMDLLIDINAELWPVKTDDKISFALGRCGRVGLWACGCVPVKTDSKISVALGSRVCEGGAVVWL